MEWDKIVLDYKNGEPISSLVRKYNKSYYSINNYLIKNNHKIVKHNKISQDKIDKVIQMINNGCIMKEIESELSFDRSTIRAIAQENNLKIKVGKPSRHEKKLKI